MTSPIPLGMTSSFARVWRGTSRDDRPTSSPLFFSTSGKEVKVGGMRRIHLLFSSPGPGGQRYDCPVPQHASSRYHSPRDVWTVSFATLGGARSVIMVCATFFALTTLLPFFSDLQFRSTPSPPLPPSSSSSLPRKMVSPKPRRRTRMGFEPAAIGS